jgi:branched-chain amino acid transport system substrate-binding protein
MRRNLGMPISAIEEPGMRRFASCVAIASILAIAILAAGTAQAQNPIRIGDINTYKIMAANMVPYRKGTDLAIEEINAAGGVLGRKLEIIQRDDNANPADAVRAAEDLRLNEKVDVLTGTILSNVGLAIADFAKHHKMFFLAVAATTDKLVWDDGNRYSFRVRASTYSHSVALVPYAASRHRKRWAFVYPNFEFGQSSVASFKALLKKAQPDVEFVADFAPPLGKVDAGPLVEALAEAKPDAIYNALFGPDLARFARAGASRGVFAGVDVVGVFTGDPEYIDPLKDDAPDGWYVTGYPWYLIKTPEHLAFLSAYQARWHDYPRISSIMGYITMKSLAAGIAKAGSTDTEALVTAFEGLEVATPSGNITYRALDHQSTLGVYAGHTVQKDGKGAMIDYGYLDGAALQPSDEEVRKRRPKD